MSLYKIFGTSILVSLVVLASGCKLFEKDESTSNSAPLFLAEEVIGTWESPCFTVTPNPGFSIHSMKETMSFIGTTLTIVDVLFSDSVCQTAYYTQPWISSFVIGGAYPSGSATRSFDFTTLSITGTANSAQAVSDFNAMSMCEYSNWAVTVEKNLSGKNCGGSVTSVGESFYSILKVDANFLYPGSSIANSASSRPTTLDEFYFVRQ